MARLDGEIKFSGSLGGLVGYKMNGKHYVRTKTSVDKQRIEKDPAFARTRELNQEFGGASTISKYLRRNWFKLMKRDKNNKVHHELNRVILEMIKNGNGPRGQRTFLWNDIASDFNGFNINNALDPEYYLSDLPTIVVANQVLQIDASNLKLMTYPKGTTHYSISIQLDEVPLFSYSAQKRKYLPANATENRIEVESPILSSDQSWTDNFQFNIPSAHNWSVVLSISFFQQVNGDFFRLSECPTKWIQIL